MRADLAGDDLSGPALTPPGQNQTIASQMEAMAQILLAQRAPGGRARAFLRAAAALRGLPAPVGGLLRERGLHGLAALRGIGDGPALAVAELVQTRRWAEFERLRGLSAPQALFRRLKGVGPRLASRLWETLHVDTLAGLAGAARDGRLDALREVGPQRAGRLRAALDELRIETGPPPPAALLLAVDRSYRAGALAGHLPLIATAPHRSPRDAWLPVLHARDGAWTVTAMHPPVRLAGGRAAFPDEVMLFARLRDGPESQWCVATQASGLESRRVVRGREAELSPASQRGEGQSP